MFEFDIAELYGVPTKALNQGDKRNVESFPENFMFQLSKEELKHWRSQIVTSNFQTKMGLRRPPYAFTEHGVGAQKRSGGADEHPHRACFVQMREVIAAHRDLGARVD